MTPRAGVLMLEHCHISLFVFWGFSFHSRIFYSYGDVTIADEGLQILTYARHSWPLSSEGYLSCHTYCYTGHPFIMVIYEDPWHSYLLPNVWRWSCHYLFCRNQGSKPDLPHTRRTLYLWPYKMGLLIYKYEPFWQEVSVKSLILRWPFRVTPTCTNHPLIALTM